MDIKQNVKVAAVQAAPVFMDLKGAVAKTIKLIEDAAEQGCDLVVFPETWLPGYPGSSNECEDEEKLWSPEIQCICCSRCERSCARLAAVYRVTEMLTSTILGAIDLQVITSSQF